MAQVKAYRGYYVSVEELVALIFILLEDAEKRKTKVILVGGENIKLEGAIMSLLAIKEALYNLERYGDFIPQKDPLISEEVRKVKEDIGESCDPIPEKE